MNKVIVIGANHAGTACINTMLDNYPDQEVVVFDVNYNISFLGCGMALWIGNQIHGADGLFYSSAKILEKKGAKICMETMVNQVDFEKKVVHVTEKDGTTYAEPYDKLVLATGSLPIIPRLEGCQLENIQKVKLFQDAQEVVDKLQNDPSIQNVTVIGAGYIGIEMVEAFKLRGKRVTLVDTASTCLPTYYDHKFTDMMCRRLERNGIILKFDQVVTGFEGFTKVSGVRTKEGVIPTDMVIWAIGFRPNNFLGKSELTLARNGAFVVDEYQQTSMNDVYAVGDCATVMDNSLGGINYIALATNAVRSGIVAAHNACGTPPEIRWGARIQCHFCVWTAHDFHWFNRGKSHRGWFGCGLYRVHRLSTAWLYVLQQPGYLTHCVREKIPSHCGGTTGIRARGVQRDPYV